MTENARFWDRIAESYAKRPVADEAVYQAKLEKTRTYLRPDMQLLEIGCGTGSTALVHAPHVAHIRATDISEAMLAIARRKAAEAGIGNVGFERAAVSELNMPDAAYDMVLALSLLHLVDDPAGLIARIHRTLKPGGLFVSSTACIADMNWAIRLALPLVRAIGKAPFVNVFTGAELDSTITSAGFAIEHRWRPGKRDAVFIIAGKPG